MNHTIINSFVSGPTTSVHRLVIKLQSTIYQHTNSKLFNCISVVIGQVVELNTELYISNSYIAYSSKYTLEMKSNTTVNISLFL